MCTNPYTASASGRFVFGLKYTYMRTKLTYVYYSEYLNTRVVLSSPDYAYFIE